MTEIKGIDVSSWQGDIDFKQVKSSGIKFVIIRAGYGREVNQKDNRFEQNYKNAKAAGLDVGAYWYSYAISPDDALQEAKACIEVIKGKQFDYPIYLDLEERSQFAKGKAFCDSIVKTFCTEIERNGYYAGLYCSASPLADYVSKDVASKYAIWVAQYYNKCTYTDNRVGIWQHTSNGLINGINGYVDCNIAYVDYPSIIKSGGFNGYAPSAKKSLGELASEVIAGKWGNGEERKKRLIEAGYNYNSVQEKVNQILLPSAKTVDELATEVINGKWGNGDDRKKRLTKAGYDYNAVQKRVNQLFKG